MNDQCTWNKEAAEAVFTHTLKEKKGIFSEKQMILFRWMSFHIYLSGSPDSNPNKMDVFAYFHGAMGAQCEFMYDHMTGTSITGMYASCGYTKYVKELDSWADEKMDYVTKMLPLSEKDYEWFVKKKHSITVRLVHVVAQMMNAYQQHHFDMVSVFALSSRVWELWCQQWHMYKRDLAIEQSYTVIPAANVKYDKVCAYLEALTRIEVQESPSKGNAKAMVTLNPPKCTFCSFWYKPYDNMTNAANAVWNHVDGCVETSLFIKGEGPLYSDSQMICMDAISIIEARMTKVGGLDFEANFEWSSPHWWRVHSTLV